MIAVNADYKDSVLGAISRKELIVDNSNLYQ